MRACVSCEGLTRSAITSFAVQSPALTLFPTLTHNSNLPCPPKTTSRLSTDTALWPPRCEGMSPPGVRSAYWMLSAILWPPSSGVWACIRFRRCRSIKIVSQSCVLERWRSAWRQSDPTISKGLLHAQAARDTLRLSAAHNRAVSRTVYRRPHRHGSLKLSRGHQCRHDHSGAPPRAPTLLA